MVGTFAVAAVLCASMFLIEAPTCRGVVLYGVGIGNDTLFSIETQTGISTAVGRLGGGYYSIEGLAYDSTTDRLLGVSDSNGGLYAINRSSGAASMVGQTGVSVLFAGLDYDPNSRKLYMTSTAFSYQGMATCSLYTVDPITGAARKVRDISWGIALDSLAFDPNSSTLYTIELLHDYNCNGLYSIDTQTGALTFVDYLQTMPIIYSGAAFDPASNLLYWTDAGRGALYARNMTSGQVSYVCAVPYETRSLALVPVPEPAMISLSALFLLGMRLQRRC